MATLCIRLAAATVGVVTGAGGRSRAAAGTVVNRTFRRRVAHPNTTPPPGRKWASASTSAPASAFHHLQRFAWGSSHVDLKTRRGRKPIATASSACMSASAAATDDGGGCEGEGSLYEAIVVVAGGMTDDGTLPPWVTSRLDFTLEEYNRHVAASSTAYVVLSGSATPHKPPTKAKGGFILHESTAMAEYLIERGVAPEHILKDTASMDTIGNAYMCLVMHAVPRNWRKVLVVTSEFHMGRTRAAFEWVWNLYVPGPNGAG